MSAYIERITGSQVGGASERSIRLSLSIIRLGPAIILLLLVLPMTLLSPVFLTGANISNIIVQTSVLAVLAIGQLFVILVAGIDLSVGSVLGLSTVTGAIVYTATSSAGGLLALLVIILTGVVIGWINDSRESTDPEHIRACRGAFRLYSHEARPGASEEVPVILLDTDIPKWKPKDSYVGTDNFAAGLAAGRYLERQMNASGSIGLITGIPGSVPGDQREAGMRKAIENIDIKFVGEVAADFDGLKAVGAMEDLLQTHPNLDAVFAANDQMALRAIEALQTYQSDAILDGAVEATQAIIGGDMDATVAQNPYAMGKVGVQQASKAAKGESIDPRINTGLTLVTKENAPKYLKIWEEQLGSSLGVEE